MFAKISKNYTIPYNNNILAKETKLFFNMRNRFDSSSPFLYRDLNFFLRVKLNGMTVVLVGIV